jgi:hypothetical protein
MTLPLQDEELGEISSNISYLYGGFQTRTGEQVRESYISWIYDLCSKCSYDVGHLLINFEIAMDD